MSRFAAFEDNALDRRVERLRRSELELENRIQVHAAEAERAGRYVAADPAYQRLAAILRTLRGELEDTTREQLRRSHGASRRPASGARRPSLTAGGRISETRGPKVMSTRTV